MIWTFSETAHQPIGVLEKFFTLRTVRSYDKNGEIEIRAPAASAAGFLIPGVLVWIEGQQHAYIIDTISIEPEDGKGDVLTATGASTGILLNRRVITESTLYSGTAGDVIAQLVSGLFSHHGFPMLDLDMPGIGPQIEYESEPQELGEAVMAVCKAGGIGYRTPFDVRTRRNAFQLYQGVDRTAGTPSPVLFSPVYDNINQVCYTDSLNPYKNVVYVLGEKPNEEGAVRMVQVVGAVELEGYARYEAVTEAAKPRTVREGEETRTLTDEEYAAVLRQHGEQFLSETPRVTSCEGQVVLGSQLYRLGVDYDLGDLVTYRDPKYGIEKNVRVQELSDEYENGVHTAHVQLGDPLPTLTEKIKRMG